jgi:hypothetical protein
MESWDYPYPWVKDWISAESGDKNPSRMGDPPGTTGTSRKQGVEPDFFHDKTGNPIKKTYYSSSHTS